MADSLDALLPPEMAVKAENLGVAKAALPAATTLMLAVLAGAFIALGAVLSTSVTAGLAGTLPFGLTRLVAGATFSLGLIAITVGGAELFTGNNLIVMAWMSRKIAAWRVLRNWTLVYAGNFIGAVATAALVVAAGHTRMGNGAVGAALFATAAPKLRFEPVQAVALGILCNALVCLAVWLSYSARTTTDRILAVVPPVTAFVACGFEHSVANMYFVPAALLARTFAPPEIVTADLHALSWSAFLSRNLLPVTVGNVIGGALLVGAAYWLIYLRSSPSRRA
jgi:formate/nitrite transporter